MKNTIDEHHRLNFLTFGIILYGGAADAWQVILKNRISMLWDCAEDASAEWWSAVDPMEQQYLRSGRCVLTISEHGTRHAVEQVLKTSVFTT
ncbi:hypothetical protein [Lelliottia nimipressuralis]|uniref:hypothetical protein n=1 Tax=Lelliottia nimipressuralis TaxID=69220 RepID=UPI003B42EF45